MGMVGLRGDLFVVAPASSFHHNQHQHEPIHHHHHHHSSDPVNNNSNTALGVGVIPLLTASPCSLGIEDAGDHHSNNNSNSNFNGNNRSTNRGSCTGIQLWQNHPSYNLKKSIMFDQNNSLLNPGGGGVLGAGATGTTSTSNTTSSSTTCQDCGNQAKKDCSHRRCRTCCKSRGYDCATHVKSTWVPAARRRERQLSNAAAAAAAAAAGSSGSTSGVKKPRLITSQTTTSHTSTSNSFDTSSSHQDASFREALPGQVRAPAVFKCVRVTAIEDGEDEYAYQAVVKIGGHVFKGFLYDQGVDGREGFPNISELHLGTSSGGPSDGGGRNGASTSPIMDPSDVYAASSGGGLIGGAAFGNPIN